MRVEPGVRLEDATNEDFIICGIPRSGTSFLAGALYQPPASVTVMEPWDGLRLPPADLMRSLREEIEDGTLRRGRLDVATLQRTGEVRWGRDGEFPHPVDVRRGFALGVKWPVFWRYLDVLPATRFLLCVRDPIAVIRSFERTGGRLAQGLEYDVAFNRELNTELLRASEDPSTRRALLYEHIAARLIPHLNDPNVLVVRYERWFADSAALMDEIAKFLGIDLGPGPAAIRSSASRGADPGIAEQVRKHCPSASGLGYHV